MTFIKAKINAKQNYWNPSEIGDSIEGNLFTWLKDKYDNDIAVLECKDKYGNYFKAILPSHKSLMEYYRELKIGEYIHVELIDLKPIEAFQTSKKVYKVLIDDERFKEYRE